MKNASTEKIIRNIWADVLNDKEIKPHSDFFDLGGDSIMALNMLFEVGSALSVDIPPGVLFNCSMFADFVLYVKKITASSNNIGKTG